MIKDKYIDQRDEHDPSRSADKSSSAQRGKNPDRARSEGREAVNRHAGRDYNLRGPPRPRTWHQHSTDHGTETETAEQDPKNNWALLHIASVHTKDLAGNPAATGFYSILLFVPAHSTIQAHSHRDDRMATVVSGNWQFGYGTHFDERALKILPPGSVYSEGGLNHFARTTDVPVVVHICGFGPTDTRYFNPADDPESMDKK